MAEPVDTTIDKSRDDGMAEPVYATMDEVSGRRHG